MYFLLLYSQEKCAVLLCETIREESRRKWKKEGKEGKEEGWKERNEGGKERKRRKEGF